MSEVAQLTWPTDLRPFIEEVHKREGAQPNPSHYERLFQECLRNLFRQTRAYDTSWSNASGGVLKLSGNAAGIPNDCLEITRVEWDGSDSVLEIVDEAFLDAFCGDWRTATGTPGYVVISGHRLIFDTTPTGATTGLLVVRGYGVPDYDKALTYLPVDCQLSPAKWVLWKLPWDPEKPIQRARYEQYRNEWRDEELRILAALNARRLQPFTFD